MKVLVTMVEILKDVRTPAQSNVTWIFKVRLDGKDPIDWKVDSFDLSMWFKEVVGRYPNHERGDNGEKADILENWARLEPRLRVEAEKEACLGVKIGVDGLRFGSKESDEAYSIPKEDLPPLIDAQKEVARKLGVSEEGYARSFVAGEKTSNWLLEKTKRFADLLRERVPGFHSGAQVESVILRTTERRFDVEVKVNGGTVPVRIREALVDEIFESGSEEAQRNLGRVLGIALRQQVPQ
jgi:hypothetical protein